MDRRKIHADKIALKNYNVAAHGGFKEAKSSKRIRLNEPSTSTGSTGSTPHPMPLRSPKTINRFPIDRTNRTRTHKGRVKDGTERRDKTRKVKANELWLTKSIADETSTDYELIVQVTAIETLFFFIFFALMCLAIYGSSAMPLRMTVKEHESRLIAPQFDMNVTTFSLHNVAPERFPIGFGEIIDETGVWAYLFSVLPNLFFTHDKNNWWDMTLNNSKTAVERVDSRILGYAQIRQLRVMNNSCVPKLTVKGKPKICYGFFDAKKADVGGYQLTTDTLNASKDNTGWIYSSEDYDNSGNHVGQLGTYPDGGYIIKMNGTLNEANDQLTDYMKHRWIDRGTRAVFVEFTALNPNTNIFLVARLIFEFSPAGIVQPGYVFTPVRLLRHQSTYDYFIKAATYCCLVFIVYYTLVEMRVLMFFGPKYFTTVWNYVSLFMLISAYTTIIVTAYDAINMQNVIERYVEAHGSRFISFESLTKLQNLRVQSEVVLLLFVWMKMFRYCLYLDRKFIISKMLKNCVGDLLHYFVVLLIIYMSFAMLGCLLFSHIIKHFISIPATMFSLLRITVGDRSIFTELYTERRFIGPLFYAIYIIAVYFVFLNFILAILKEAFIEVSIELVVNKPISLLDYFKRFTIRSLLLVFNRRRLLKGNEKDHCKKLLRAALVELNFSEPEVNMFMMKYDINHEKLIDVGEIREKIRVLKETNFKVTEHESNIDRLRKEEQWRDQLKMNKKKPEVLFDVILKDYKTIKSRIDEIQIQIETMLERTNRIPWLKRSNPE